MINEIINKLIEAREQQKREDDLLLQLQTNAEGVGSIKYGDDTSHGTDTGDRLEIATIKLAEARERIAKKRVGRFDLEAEVCDWLYDYLAPSHARVMVLYVVDGLSYRDISARTGYSIGWISNAVKNAKEILK